MGAIRLALAIVGASWLLTTACGGSDNKPAQSQDFTEAADVFTALVQRLEDENKVLHANVVSTQSDSPDESTFEFWIDEAKDLARKDAHLANVLPKDRKIIIADGQAYSYVGSGDPAIGEAPSCEGTKAPATALLFRCEAVAGSHSELVDSEPGTLRVETTGSYGAEIENKPWTITVTFDEESLMPLTGESDLWGLLNNQPYESRETWTYTTELVDRDDLPGDLFDLD